MPTDPKTAPGSAMRPAMSRTTRLILMALTVICAGLLIADFAIPRKSNIAAENLFGFYALCGLVSSVVIALVARAVRRLLSAEETYYDE